MQIKIEKLALEKKYSADTERKANASLNREKMVNYMAILSFVYFFLWGEANGKTFFFPSRAAKAVTRRGIYSYGKGRQVRCDDNLNASEGFLVNFPCVLSKPLSPCTSTTS